MTRKKNFERRNYPAAFVKKKTTFELLNVCARALIPEVQLYFSKQSREPLIDLHLSALVSKIYRIYGMSLKYGSREKRNTVQKAQDALRSSFYIYQD